MDGRYTIGDVTHQTSQAGAAQSLVALLDEYRDQFDLMLEAELEPEACNRVAECLDRMLPLRQLLVDEASVLAMNFTLAHSDLMTELFTAQMARMGSDRKGRLIMMVPPDALYAHKRAIDDLRAACENLLEQQAPFHDFEDTRPSAP